MQDITSDAGLPVGAPIEDDERDTPPRPGAFNAAAYLLAANAARGDQVAYIDDTRRITYAALDDEVRRAAAGLLALGLRREERVLMVMQDSIDFVTCFLGALYAGLVPVPVNTLLTAEDYAHMFDDSRARAVVASAGLFDRVTQAFRLSTGHHVVHFVASGSAVPPPSEPRSWPWLSTDGSPLPAPAGSEPLGRSPDPWAWSSAAPYAGLLLSPPLPKPADTLGDDIGFWLYSSGSTGRPKGTVHTHRNLYWTAALYATPVLGLRADDTCFSAAKLFFAYGLGNALTFPMSVGATTVLMAERPTPQAVFKRWVEHGVTVFFGAPTGYAGMLAAAELPPKGAVKLRLCSSAGEALPRELGERFQTHYGCEIVDGIGSTEMLHIFLSNRPGDVNYGTTGRAVPGYRLRLVDEAGADAADGEIGDLYVAGPSAALMYWGQREKSRATFLGEWTKTGDKYSVDARGCYVYAGRSDDMLKVSGVYVSPFEVEATLMQHPAVLECAVFGKVDANGLTKTKACVVRKAGHTVTEIELQAFVKDRLAPYKYPRFIEFIDDLPKTATGKIQRFRLREREREAAPVVPSTAAPE